MTGVRQMPKNIKSFLKKHIIAIWITAAALTLVTLSVMASYTNQSNKAKKVVATAATTEMRFSSNYLEESCPYKTIVINSGEAINVDVRNYGRESTIPYSSDINYTLTAALTDSSGNPLSPSKVTELIGTGSVIIKAVTITENNGVETESETDMFTLNSSKISDNNGEVLAAGSVSVNHFHIYFPEPNSKINVKITATPSNSHKDLREISAIFAVSDKSSVQNTGWTGQFNDSTATSVSGYDAFNYVISGSGDSTSAVIRWNSDFVSVNQQYLTTKMGAGAITDVSGRTGWKQVTVTLNTTESSGRYAFQVFKTSSFSTSVTSWDALNACIEFDDGM